MSDITPINKRHEGFWYVSARQQGQILLMADMELPKDEGWVEYGEADEHRIALIEEKSWDRRTIKRENWVRFGAYRVSSTVSIEDAIDKAFMIWRVMYTGHTSEQANDLAWQRYRRYMAELQGPVDSPLALDACK